MYHPEKAGTLPVEGGFDPRQTNETGTFIPLLEGIDIQGKDITADALLTQRKPASFVVDRKAHYHFTVKDNQASLKTGIALLFENRKKPDSVEITPPDYGRIETRRIWRSTVLNEPLDFPHAGQVFLIERETLYKRTGKVTGEAVLGVTSRTPEQAGPERILKVNRGHWTIENRCHYVIDWNFDEDRSRSRTGHGPGNITRLRRFACGVIQFISKGKSSISQKMQQLNRNTRLVFDYLRVTSNLTRTRSH